MACIAKGCVKNILQLVRVARVMWFPDQSGRDGSRAKRARRDECRVVLSKRHPKGAPQSESGHHSGTGWTYAWRHHLWYDSWKWMSKYVKATFAFVLSAGFLGNAYSCTEHKSQLCFRNISWKKSYDEKHSIAELYMKNGRRRRFIDLFFWVAGGVIESTAWLDWHGFKRSPQIFLEMKWLSYPSTRVLLAKRMQCSHRTLDTGSGMRTCLETSPSRWLNISNSFRIRKRKSRRLSIQADDISILILLFCEVDAATTPAQHKPEKNRSLIADAHNCNVNSS